MVVLLFGIYICICMYIRIYIHIQRRERSRAIRFMRQRWYINVSRPDFVPPPLPPLPSFFRCVATLSRICIQLPLPLPTAPRPRINKECLRLWNGNRYVTGKICLRKSNCDGSSCVLETVEKNLSLTYKCIILYFIVLFPSKFLSISIRRWRIPFDFQRYIQPVK